MERSALVRARRNLVRIGLIAYQKPLYQALALESRTLDGKLVPAARETFAQKPSGRGGMQSLSEIFTTIHVRKL